MKATDSTVTRKGVIRHRRHPQGFLMPVKLIVGAKPKLVQEAVVASGRLVYALPGGGSYVG